MKLIGNPDQLIYGINEIHKVISGDLTFVDVEKYYSKSIHSDATVILINKETDEFFGHFFDRCNGCKIVVVGMVGGPYALLHGEMVSGCTILPQKNGKSV